MSKTISFSLSQIDQVNLALDRASAILEVVTAFQSCGDCRSHLNIDDVIVTAQVVKDELAQVRSVLETSNGDRADVVAVDTNA